MINVLHPLTLSFSVDTKTKHYLCEHSIMLVSLNFSIFCSI